MIDKTSRTPDAFFARLEALGIAKDTDLAKMLQAANPDLGLPGLKVTVSRWRNGARELPAFAWLWLDAEERARVAGSA